MMLNQEKFQELARKVHSNAKAHGWHDEKKPDEHWLCMIMTEVAEAVEADRKNSKAFRKIFERESVSPQLKDHREKHWQFCFDRFIKNTLEDEFADICIRIFDYAYEKFGEDMLWMTYRVRIHEEKPFTSIAFHFVKDILNSGMMNLSEAILFIYEWADKLDIDLDWHIAAKMRYNESRPYKHGKSY